MYALVGYGYWGEKILKNLNTHGAKVKYIIDSNPKRVELASHTNPDAIVDTDDSRMLNDNEVDAVVVILPASLHYGYVKKCLECGKNVLVEKPFTLTLEEAKELNNIAIANGKVLMVDHTYLYSQSMRAVKKRIEERKEKILHIESIRSNMGIFRKDANVCWDLMPHDLSIMLYLLGTSPTKVRAFGSCHNGSGVVDCAHAFLQFGDVSVNVSSSWISPKKIRLMQIITDKEIIEFDDVLQYNKVTAYKAGFKEEGGNTICYNEGMEHLPDDDREPLYYMIGDFINAVSKGVSPLSDASFSTKVVSILESIDKSINEGKEIKLDSIQVSGV